MPQPLTRRVQRHLADPCTTPTAFSPGCPHSAASNLFAEATHLGQAGSSALHQKHSQRLRCTSTTRYQHRATG